MIAFKNICCNKKFIVSIGCHEHLLEAALRGVPANQLESENIEILYLLCVSKEPGQIDCKKACCYGTSMNINNILLTYLLKTSLIHFMALVFYYTS